MRKGIFLATLSVCGIWMALPAVSGASSPLTSCFWTLKAGHYCRQAEWQQNLFYRYHTWGRIPQGCKSHPGRVSMQGLSHKHRPWIALTFDDGPSIYTPSYLRILKTHRVPATFFLIGEQISADSKLVQQELGEGHLVGNHSWNHPMLTSSRVYMQSQIKDTQQAIQKTTHFRTCIMRPPYGAWNGQVQRTSARYGLQVVLWDVDTRDWSKLGVEYIVSSVLSRARNGSIVLMHDGGGDRSQTVAALPRIIVGLKQRGFRMVGLDKILGLKMKYPIRYE